MRQLNDEGMGIVFITHFIDQVYEVADRITVLRTGKLVGTYETASLPYMELIAKMIGRSLSDFDEMSKIINLTETRGGAAPLPYDSHVSLKKWQS